MIGHRHIDKICIFTALAALVITVLFTQGEALGIKTLHSSPGYEARLFDDSRVHTIDLQLEDWEAFLAAAPSEAYFRCDAVIDGRPFPTPDFGQREIIPDVWWQSTGWSATA